MKDKKGITLISLVITIVVLLILSGVTINVVFSDVGIINIAKKQKEVTENEMEEKENKLNELYKGLAEVLDPPLKTTETTKVEDEKGNILTIPKGFKVIKDANEDGITDTVQDGIVIEDTNGNQFVWIPVNQKIIKNDNTLSETIKLGRYIFDETTGEPTLVQDADDYESQTELKTSDTDTYFYKEYTTSRESNYIRGITGLNATAKNLAEFISSVKANGGYYIARYEASFGEGTVPGKYNNPISSIITNQKPLSQPSETNSESSMNYEPKTLWNFIVQGDASKVCKNMYSGNSKVGVESDLINSYAWDTAIVYIQEMENINYAGVTNVSSGTLKNTGETSDRACNIYDMAGNLQEYTTEYCSYIDEYIDYAAPFSARGGVFDYKYTGFRNYNDVSSYSSIGGFRPILYIK